MALGGSADRRRRELALVIVSGRSSARGEAVAVMLLVTPFATIAIKLL